MSGVGYRIDVVTIFPEYLSPLRHSLLGRAAERGLASPYARLLGDGPHGAGAPDGAAPGEEAS